MNHDPEVLTLADEMRKQYQKVRVLEDGSIICLHRLLSTTAILTGITRLGWERRFCFEDHELAHKRFDEMKSEDEIPQGFNYRRQIMTNFIEVPHNLWPEGSASEWNRLRVWMSGKFLVQEFLEPGDGPVLVRLSINRTGFVSGNGWAEGISWDELQSIKNELGYHKHCAVEIYPPMVDEVKVANIRHLWVLRETPAYIWSKKCPPPQHQSTAAENGIDNP